MAEFPKRVVVTGGAGYVGSALVPRLVSLGYDVTVIDLLLFGRHVLDGVSGPGRLRVVELDIRDGRGVEREFSGADAVIHLACVSNDPSFELDPTLGRSINYDAFQGLLRAVRVNGVRRFIYASSSSVYGVRNEPDVREETPCTPLTDYSRFKLLCEQELHAAALGDCRYVILRPATVCGYAPRLRLDLTVNILTIHALVRRRITVHGGAQLRPNIHIQDIVEAYRLLLEAPEAAIHGKTFNAGYENRSVADLALLVKEEIGDPQIEIVTQPTHDHRSYHINSDRIQAELGFIPRHTLRDAVRGLKTAYESRLIPDALTEPRYYNLKTMALRMEHGPVPPPMEG